MDVNEHQGLSNITLICKAYTLHLKIYFSKERYGCNMNIRGYLT